MPDTEAKTGVNPGALGLTVAWLVGVLSDELVTGVTLTTLGLVSDHVKGPTEAVMSTPLLKALASKVVTWFDDRQPDIGVKPTAQA